MAAHVSASDNSQAETWTHEFGSEPGATIMWFGKHESKRFDQLDMEYRLALVHLLKTKKWPNVRSGWFSLFEFCVDPSADIS